MAFKKTTTQTTEREISYEVVEKFGAFGTPDKNGFQWELRLVSWNGAAAKYDIRQWGEVDGEEKMRKGITLTEDQVAGLYEVLKKIAEEEE